ncbi:MAG: putative Ig domain-containing protein, partial [Actinomycetia bacterium]|nr:putative Ig domain-containing protein [Actinomycetes bacterium]
LGYSARLALSGDYSVPVGGHISLSPTLTTTTNGVAAAPVPVTGVTYAVTTGGAGAPAGLIANDVFTPTTAGAYEIQATYTDANGTYTASKNVIATAPPVAPVITTSSLPDASTGSSYQTTLTATGDDPMAWSLAAGALPDGLALDQGTGTISGTIGGGATSPAGTYQIVVQAANQAGSDMKALNLTVVDDTWITGPTSVTLTKGYGLTVVPFSATPGASIYTYTSSNEQNFYPWGYDLRIEPGLPVGTYQVRLIAESGGSWDTLYITVYVVASPVAPLLRGPSAMTLLEGYAATSSGEFTASGTAPIAVTKTSGSSAIVWNATTQRLDIAGGLTAGVYPVVMSATNGVGSYDMPFTLTVAAAPQPTVTGVVVLPVSADVWQGDSQQFTAVATGLNIVPQSVTWRVSGATSSGTSITPDGLLAIGADETASVVTVTATSTLDTTVSGSSAVTVVPSTTRYRVTVRAGSGASGSGSYTEGTMVSIDAGTPPAGMKFESWTSGDVTFADSSSASTMFTMPVKNVIVVATWMVAVPTITTTSLPDCQIDESYQQRLAATGDTPITWSIAAGRLPDGFTLSPDGVISGTPVWEGGSLVDTYPITVQASNQAGSDTKSLTLSIVAPADTPTIFGPDYIGLVEGYGTVTIPYAVGPSGVSDTASVDAAAGSLVTWYAHSGLKIDPGLTTGNYAVVVTAGSAPGPQTRMTVWIVVTPVPVAPRLTGPLAQTLYTGYAATSSARFNVFSGTGTIAVTKTGGDAAITWNDTTHRLDIASGLANGIYPVTLTASNGVSPDFTTTFILTVASPPAPTVLSVTVTPAAASPAPGDTTQFAATVAGSNGPASDVTWAVSGASSAGTSISSSGLLTLGSDETSALLTVTATSVADTT